MTSHSTDITELFDDLLALPVGVQEGLSAWAFAILNGRDVLLMDAVYSAVQPAVARLAKEGFRMRGLVLSHRHVVGTADVSPRAVAARWSIPLFLHPIDAAHLQAEPGRPFEDPTDHPLLREFSTRSVLFPGHTAGHVLLHIDRHGGIVLAGDCAMGVRPGSEHLAFVRPPVFFNVNDEQLRNGWKDLHLPIRSLIAYHGEPALDRDDLRQLMVPLTRAEPTKNFDASPVRPVSTPNAR